MPLTHVCKWVNHEGWVLVTAEEEAHLHTGGTISARERLYRCDLCHQYVTLTDGPIYDRHFRHSSREEDKSCSERARRYGAGDGSSVYCFRPRDFSLPLCLRLYRDSGAFDFEIGFSPLPPNLYERYANDKLRITFSCEDVKTREYLIERLNPDAMTYLSVGDSPAEEYKLEDLPSELMTYWPAYVRGLTPPGTLFGVSSENGDYVFCKRVPDLADVRVNRPYYLFTKREIVGRDHLRAEKILSTKYWYIYRVEATAFEEDAARFFLDYHYGFVESSVQMSPIWPVCVESPYIIYHHADKPVNMFLQGDAVAKASPGTVTPYPLDSYGCANEKKKLLHISCCDRRQVIAAGRVNILKRYILIGDGMERYRADLPKVDVFDYQNNIVSGGKYAQLPARKELTVKAPYDGSIVIRVGRKITARYGLKADKSFLLPPVQFGQTIEIYQGLDCVWSASFEREQKEEYATWNENNLLLRLCRCRGAEVETAHSLGAMGARLKRYPKVRQWFYRATRRGRISRRALQLIKAITEGA